MSIRPVKRIVSATPHTEGAGVKLRRAFGFGETSEFDPFLLFDDFATRTRTTTSPASRGTRTGIGDHLRLAGNVERLVTASATRQPWRRSVDDRGQRHHASEMRRVMRKGACTVSSY
jgi:hypothetical protein